jgi:hypothetical protein
VRDNFTKAELECAILGLHLPSWSRGYIPCHENKSEVTCDQVFHAWQILNGWADSQMAGFNDVNHFLMRHLYDGVGNRLSTETATFVIALMDNRSYSVASFYPARGKRLLGQAFDFHPAVTILNPTNQSEVDLYFEKAPSFPVHTFESWFTYQFSLIFKQHNSIVVDLLLYATMPYTNPELANFCYTHFGRHMVYFVCNYLMRIPERAMEEARKVIDPIPREIRTFGVHLRFHQAGRYFSYSEKRTMKTVRPFLNSVMAEKPTVFAFASDSATLERYFVTAFRGKTVRTRAVRKSDRDHASALFDLALLEMSEELLLTYRSTFSYIAMARTARRAWFVDKETPDVFQISNSQATIISMAFHQFDCNDWQTSRRFRISGGVEATWRQYFQYFIL